MASPALVGLLCLVIGFGLGCFGVFMQYDFLNHPLDDPGGSSTSTRLLIIFSGLAALGFICFGAVQLHLALGGNTQIEVPATASPNDTIGWVLFLAGGVVTIVIFVVVWMTYDPTGRGKRDR